MAKCNPATSGAQQQCTPRETWGWHKQIHPFLVQARPSMIIILPVYRRQFRVTCMRCACHYHLSNALLYLLKGDYFK